MIRRLRLRGAAVLIVAGLIALPLAPAPPPPGALVAARLCHTLQVWSTSPGADSWLVGVELPSGASTVLATLHHQVNAIGYAANQALVYGMTDSGAVVTIDGTGQDHVLGPVRDTHQQPDPALVAQLTGPVAGAVLGDQFYLRAGDALYTVDIDPASADYLAVTRTIALSPVGLAASVDDFDVDPATGLLYSVVVTGIWSGEVVTIDPDNGHIAPLGVAVPSGADYGAVTLGPDHVLYATNDDLDGRRVLYRVALDGYPPPTAIDSGPAVALSDATGCFTPVPPPARAALRPPPVKASIPPTPTIPPVTVAPRPIPPQPSPVEPVRRDEITTQRRWALAGLVLLLGAGAAGARARSHR